MAMILAIANVWFKENLYNAAYVAKYVEPTGFQKWKDYVLGNTPGYDGSDGQTSPDGAIDRTPEWASSNLRSASGYNPGVRRTIREKQASLFEFRDWSWKTSIRYQLSKGCALPFSDERGPGLPGGYRSFRYWQS